LSARRIFALPDTQGFSPSLSSSNKAKGGYAFLLDRNDTQASRDDSSSYTLTRTKQVFYPQPLWMHYLAAEPAAKPLHPFHLSPKYPSGGGSNRGIRNSKEQKCKPQLVAIPARLRYASHRTRPPALEDVESIQVSISLLIAALARNRITSKRAAVLLYGLQLASTNARSITIEPSASSITRDLVRTKSGLDLAPREQRPTENDPRKQPKTGSGTARQAD
jgi:hypothetical protein